MTKNLHKQKSSVNQNQLYLDIEDAPPRVRAYGLSAAHPWPLVGVRDDDGAGRIVRSLRVQQRKAWEYTDVGYPHSATAWAAVVVDVDTPAKIHEVIHGGSSLLPNWIVFNRRNGHAHVCYPLASPVLEHPESNLAPLKYLADVEKEDHRGAGWRSGILGSACPKSHYETAMEYRNSMVSIVALGTLRTGRSGDRGAPGWMENGDGQAGSRGEKLLSFRGIDGMGRARENTDSKASSRKRKRSTRLSDLRSQTMKSSRRSRASPNIAERWEAARLAFAAVDSKANVAGGERASCPTREERRTQSRHNCRL